MFWPLNVEFQHPLPAHNKIADSFLRTLVQGSVYVRTLVQGSVYEVYAEVQTCVLYTECSEILRHLSLFASWPGLNANAHRFTFK